MLKILRQEFFPKFYRNFFYRNFIENGKEWVKLCSDMLLKLASEYICVKTFVTGITSYLEIFPRRGVELPPIATHG